MKRLMVVLALACVPRLVGASLWAQGQQDVRPPLGSLSERYETGGRGPGTVSTGVGDLGGVSYGTYQMTSVTGGKTGGTVAEFVRRHYPQEFAGLTPGTDAFTARWQRLAREQPAQFTNVQHEFIRQTHYDPLVQRVQRESGLEVNSRSRALQNAVWSTAVQHGANTPIIRRALASAGRPIPQLTDEEILRAIYTERGRTNTNGIPEYFESNSIQVQQAQLRRFTNEQRDALRQLAAERQATKDLDTEAATLQREDDRLARWRQDLQNRAADLKRRFKQHNDNPPDSTDRAAVARYAAQAKRLETEKTAWEAEARRCDAERRQLLERRQQLEQRKKKAIDKK